MSQKEMRIRLLKDDWVAGFTWHLLWSQVKEVNPALYNLYGYDHDYMEILWSNDGEHWDDVPCDSDHNAYELGIKVKITKTAEMWMYEGDVLRDDDADKNWMLVYENSMWWIKDEDGVMECFYDCCLGTDMILDDDLKNIGRKEQDNEQANR